ncbi:DUF4148 domain-containing protein [Caballeronia sp. ATUFL_M1_KS5A]|uniref:DUF4148 domain-containing protein n=1 Tax=Caballeronia sp. ATUFL_M1_KS5A TaxID=2921778 RepID=UPI002029737B|nr:DUF4148 domain-containing protein [Caballeronia sp. ATUFL_M1_KS5A]
MLSIAKLIVPVFLAIPGLALAEPSAPLAHAQAQEHLVQLEKAGYSPLVNDPLYPRRLQQAEATLSKKPTTDGAYGPEIEGTVQAGRSR